MTTLFHLAICVNTWGYGGCGPHGDRACTTQQPIPQGWPLTRSQAFEWLQSKLRRPENGIYLY